MTDSDSDLGLFGPDSVTWRVHVEPILWFAGYRALLLQTLHPRALAGVLQNSNFREDPWGRLIRTARFYGEVVFGDTPTARKAGRRVLNTSADMPEGSSVPNSRLLTRPSSAAANWSMTNLLSTRCANGRRHNLTCFMPG